MQQLCNGLHSLHFSFAGVSTRKQSRAHAHTHTHLRTHHMHTGRQNEQSHFKLLTQARQQRGSHYEAGKAATASRSTGAAREQVSNAHTARPLPDRPISSALILDSHITRCLPYYNLNSFHLHHSWNGTPISAI